MPRIPRLYRVVATYRNGETATRHYQTPKAADERAARFLQGRPAQLSGQALADEMAAQLSEPGPWPVDVPEVVVTASYPVVYPHAAGDAVLLDIPDASLSRNQLHEILRLGGVDPLAVVGMTWAGENVLEIQYHADVTRKGAPLTWRVELT